MRPYKRLYTLQHCSQKVCLVGFVKAVEMVASGVLPLDRIITHKYPLRHFKKGIQQVLTHKTNYFIVYYYWEEEKQEFKV